MPSTEAAPLLHHRDHSAQGVEAAPPLLLGPSLGTSLALWDPLVPALTQGRRVVAYDLPGHGGSDASLLPAGASVADLAARVLDLADALGIERFAYAGVSLGGAVGLWLAAHRPERVSSLAVVCSSARFGEPEGWRQRAALVRAEGTAAVAASTPERWFTPAFRATARAHALLDDLRATDPAGYAACCDALATFDMRESLSGIDVPTLVVAGRADPATPPSHARLLADGIPHASLTEIAGAAHLAGAERPEPVLAALLAHLAEGGGEAGPAVQTPRDASSSQSDEARHAAGMTVRRAVLGDAHVDRAQARTSAFTEVFQDFITRYAWGEIWTRPGLHRTTRSCITLTALTARGHLDELAMHVRAALRNGLTPEEIREVLLQSAVYCGVPAANSAFAVADRVLREEREEGTDTGE